MGILKDELVIRDFRIAELDIPMEALQIHGWRNYKYIGGVTGVFWCSHYKWFNTILSGISTIWFVIIV